MSFFSSTHRCRDGYRTLHNTSRAGGAGVGGWLGKRLGICDTFAYMTGSFEVLFLFNTFIFWMLES
jgi:hypothetical protein